MFSKKATKIDEIFTVDLTLCSKCQIDGEISSIFVAFLENMNFNPTFKKLKDPVVKIISSHLLQKYVSV